MALGKYEREHDEWLDRLEQRELREWLDQPDEGASGDQPPEDEAAEDEAADDEEPSEEDGSDDEFLEHYEAEDAE